MTEAARRIAIIGANGAIGAAFVRYFARQPATERIYAFARQCPVSDDAKVTVAALDYLAEDELAQAAALIGKEGSLDLIVIATGVLHDVDIMPERSLRELNRDKLQHLFDINTIGPALAAKHFLPCLPKNQRAVFAVLSARIGSITDNKLGGWYAYRASKAALNMIVKTAAIEMARQRPAAIIVGLHPGTVDSNLSKPFQKNVATNRLFTPDEAVTQLAAVLDGLQAKNSGKCFAYDGTEVLP